MNALSSFWSETPVYCAITMDLNPVAFKPFAQIPQIPQVERIEQLKTYGDADSTESTSARVNAPVPSAGEEEILRTSPGEMLLAPELEPGPIVVTTSPNTKYVNFLPSLGSMSEITKVPSILSSISVLRTATDCPAK